MNRILDKLQQRMNAADTLVCVGLDPVVEQMPAEFRDTPEPLFEFCRHIVEQTAEYAAAFKPNSAFFEAHGAAGMAQLARLCAHMRSAHPQIVTICDAKRGDNANTNRGYVTAIFDELGCDAVTLHPYLGREALAPFLDRDDRACVLLCRTSNAGAAELQDLDCGGRPLWMRVAEAVTGRWNSGGNCWLVVGATYPGEMERVRALAPHTVFLVPGIGAQGGDLHAVLAAGLDAWGAGLLISSSRAIAGADDPAAAARELRDDINRLRGELRA